MNKQLLSQIYDHQLAIESGIRDLNTLERIAIASHSEHTDSHSDAIIKITVESLAGIYNLSTEDFMGSLWDNIVKIWRAIVATITSAIKSIMDWITKQSDGDDKEDIDIKGSDSSSRDVDETDLAEYAFGSSIQHDLKMISEGNAVDLISALNADLAVITDFTSNYIADIAKYISECNSSVLDFNAILDLHNGLENPYVFNRKEMSEKAGLNKGYGIIEKLPDHNDVVVNKLDSFGSPDADIFRKGVNQKDVDINGSGNLFNSTYLVFAIANKLSLMLGKSEGTGVLVKSLSTRDYNTLYSNKPVKSIKEFKSSINKLVKAVDKENAKLTKTGKGLVSDLKKISNKLTNDDERQILETSLRNFNTEMKLISIYILNITKLTTYTYEQLKLLSRYYRYCRKIYKENGWTVDKEGMIS